MERHEAARAAAGGAEAAPGARAVVDVGCGRGEASLFAAAHGLRALCFEPDQVLQRDLQRGLALNNETGHLVWIQVGVRGWGGVGGCWRCLVLFLQRRATGNGTRCSSAVHELPATAV